MWLWKLQDLWSWKCCPPYVVLRLIPHQMDTDHRWHVCCRSWWTTSAFTRTARVTPPACRPLSPSSASPPCRSSWERTARAKVWQRSILTPDPPHTHTTNLSRRGTRKGWLHEACTPDKPALSVRDGHGGLTQQNYFLMIQACIWYTYNYISRLCLWCMLCSLLQCHIHDISSDGATCAGAVEGGLCTGSKRGYMCWCGRGWSVYRVEAGLHVLVR